MIKEKRQFKGVFSLFKKIELSYNKLKYYMGSKRLKYFNNLLIDYGIFEGYSSRILKKIEKCRKKMNKTQKKISQISKGLGLRYSKYEQKFNEKVVEPSCTETEYFIPNSSNKVNHLNEDGTYRLKGDEIVDRIYVEYENRLVDKDKKIIDEKKEEKTFEFDKREFKNRLIQKNVELIEDKKRDRSITSDDIENQVNEETVVEFSSYKELCEKYGEEKVKKHFGYPEDLTLLNHFSLPLENKTSSDYKDVRLTEEKTITFDDIESRVNKETFVELSVIYKTLCEKYGEEKAIKIWNEKVKKHFGCSDDSTLFSYFTVSPEEKSYSYCKK